MAAPGHEQVGRLHVAVDDPLGVRGVERIRDLGTQIENRRFRQRAGREERLERLPLEQLHRQEALFFVLAEIVDRADVRVVQRGSGAGLTLESFDRGRIVRQFRGEELQRDMSSEAQILGSIDDAHAAAADLFDHAIVRDGSADHRLTPRWSTAQEYIVTRH